MNVEKMINHIKGRPGMYVGEIKLSNIEQFIRGFNFNNAISNRVEPIDIFFRTEFHSWISQWLDENYGIKGKGGGCWTPRITQVIENEEEAVDTFFRICEEFFKEYHAHEEDLYK